jgi:hypothetical protein
MRVSGLSIVMPSGFLIHQKLFWCQKDRALPEIYKDFIKVRKLWQSLWLESWHSQNTSNGKSDSGESQHSEQQMAGLKSPKNYTRGKLDFKEEEEVIPILGFNLIPADWPQIIRACWNSRHEEFNRPLI